MPILMCHNKVRWSTLKFTFIYCVFFFCSNVNSYKYGDGTVLKYCVWYISSSSIEVKLYNSDNRKKNLCDSLWNRKTDFMNYVMNSSVLMPHTSIVPIHTKHNTLTFPSLDLFHPSTSFGQSLWPFFITSLCILLII